MRRSGGRERYRRAVSRLNSAGSGSVCSGVHSLCIYFCFCFAPICCTPLSRFRPSFYPPFLHTRGSAGPALFLSWTLTATYSPCKQDSYFILIPPLVIIVRNARLRLECLVGVVVKEGAR